MKWWFKKPKKLNETTRLYALYGESANLDFLDSTIKDNTTKINENTTKINENTQNIQTNKNNIQNNANKIELNKQNIQTNVNKIETNKQSIINLENRVNNIPKPDLSKYARLDKRQLWTQQQDFENANINDSFIVRANLGRGYLDVVNINDDKSLINLDFYAAGLNRKADLNKNNEFTAENRFTGNVSFNNATVGGTLAATSLQLNSGNVALNSVNSPTSIVNKQYVDNVISQQAYRKRNTFATYQQKTFNVVADYWTLSPIRLHTFKDSLGSVYYYTPSDIQGGQFQCYAYGMVEFSNGHQQRFVIPFYGGTLSPGSTVSFSFGLIPNMTVPESSGTTRKVVVFGISGIRIS